MPSLLLEEARRRAALLSVSMYDVTLDLSGDDKTFMSQSVIRFTARAAAETFLDIQPRHLRAVRLDGSVLDVGRLRDGRMPLTLAQGDHELVVEAVMGYRIDGEGLHRSTDPADGRSYVYGMSFLDAAPSIFACFDQPDLKAPYTFHVTAPEGWVVIGNGRATQVEPGRWELTTTPPLSTYFVTLVAGPYHQLTAEHDGIALGLQCRQSLAPHLDQDAQEILTVTGQCFDEYHRLFGVSYAFGDYHQAFVPEFNAGAMENPGCVTFRDPLVFSSKVTRRERVNRAVTIAHEMAHQWFGDLVTMQWWDDLWLNESFAQYLGTRVTADVTEFTDAWVDDGFARRRWGIVADQRRSTHPVAGNGAVDAMAALQDFDGISYAKGSAVLKQLNARLGDGVFFAGVREHFARHRFGNATMADLLDAWESAGAANLDAWTENWLRTPGLDLIRLDRSGAEPTIVKVAPPDHPATREHAISVAHHSPAVGWSEHDVVLTGGHTPVPSVTDQPVVLDPREATWARIGLDDLTLAALPDLLPAVEDPVLRSAVWNAVRDGVTNASVAPRVALQLLAVALPVEAKDVAVETLSGFGVTVADRLVGDPVAAYAQLHEAVRRRLSTAAPGSGVQLAAMRASVATSSEATVLRRWLEARDVPAGITVDRDLRWKLLIRLATLGSIDRTELDDAYAAEPTTQAKVDLTQALAALPEADAKADAWARFTGEVAASNYELEAAGAGLWQRGQDAVTAPYVERYFDDVAGTAQVRSGWVLADAARAFFPWPAIARPTLEAARSLLADDSVDRSLHRAVADLSDDLEKNVQVREKF